ncbi:MAG: hypothetical protein ABSF98_09265 [Bryobacteraceae bacterium]
MKATLVATKQFDAAVTDLLTADELGELEFAIASNPAAYPVSDSRNRRRPKSALVTVRNGVALLLAAYAKNVQENLTNDQKRKAQRLVRDFEECLGP